MPGQAASIENFTIDADAIVANPQRKVEISISNLCFYILRPCVTKGIAQRLTGETVDFVAENRVKVLRLAFY